MWESSTWNILYVRVITQSLDKVYSINNPIGTIISVLRQCRHVCNISYSWGWGKCTANVDNFVRYPLTKKGERAVGIAHWLCVLGFNNTISPPGTHKTDFYQLIPMLLLPEVNIPKRSETWTVMWKVTFLFEMEFHYVVLVDLERVIFLP